MARAIPIFFLAGGEIVLLLIALRIGVWVLRGWHDWGSLARDRRRDDPRGPGGGLRLVSGGRGGGGDAEPASLRRAA